MKKSKTPPKFIVRPVRRVSPRIGRVYVWSARAPLDMGDRDGWAPSIEYTLASLIPHLRGADGYSEWVSYIMDNADEPLSTILESACEDGLRWGLKALGLSAESAAYDAAVQPAKAAHDAVVQPAKAAYDAAVQPAEAAHDAAVQPASAAAAIQHAIAAYDAAVQPAKAAYAAVVQPAIAAYAAAVQPAKAALLSAVVARLAARESEAQR